MDDKIMASNDCQGMDEEKGRDINNINILEVSEAIHDLDNKLTELENALRINRTPEQ